VKWISHANIKIKMPRSELYDKIYYSQTDRESRAIFGARDFNTNAVYLTITDGELVEDHWIHLREPTIVLHRYTNRVTHIIFIGIEKSIERLDLFINSVSWKMLRHLDILEPTRTVIPTTLLKSPKISIAAKIINFDVFKETVLGYFYKHTMIWMDHEHTKITTDQYERGLVSNLRYQKWFENNEYSITSKISVARTTGAMILEGEELICEPVKFRRGRIIGKSLFTDTSAQFSPGQFEYKVVIKPNDIRYQFIPTYDTVIYYGKSMKEVNIENLIKCQLLSRSNVIVLLNDDKERDKLSALVSLDV
jgi:hypothetical protein